VYVGILLGIVALAAGLVYRTRLIRAIGGSPPIVTDELVRQIEEVGYVEIDDPLDLDEIQEEEARFWEEKWDEPEEF
jgi:hypothetical protein